MDEASRMAVSDKQVENPILELENRPDSNNTFDETKSVRNKQLTEQYSELIEKLKKIGPFRIDVNNIDSKTGCPKILRNGDKKVDKPNLVERKELPNGFIPRPFRIPKIAISDPETKLSINKQKIESVSRDSKVKRKVSLHTNVNRSKDKGKATVSNTITSKRISHTGASYLYATHKQKRERNVKTSLFKSPVPESRNHIIKPKSLCPKLDTNSINDTLPLIDLNTVENTLLNSPPREFVTRPLKPNLPSCMNPSYFESPATKEFCAFERQFQCSKKTSTVDILNNINDISIIEKYDQDFKDFTLLHSKNMDLLHAMKQTDINEILEKEKQDFEKIIHSHTTFMGTLRDKAKDMLKNGKENQAPLFLGTPKSRKMKNCLSHLSNTNIRLIEQQQYGLLQDTPIRK